MVKRDASGFRLRGLEATRIETFTDAAFAFALTLLVVSLEPPTNFEALTHAMQRVPAFLLSATILMVFWWGHHEWSRRYGLDDLTTMVLSCLLVFTVLIYVYPLRFMFGAMMAWIGWMTGLPLGYDVRLGGSSEVNALFMVYGIGYGCMSASLVLLNLHAWRKRETLGLDAVERHETRVAVGVWLIQLSVAMASTTMAVALPPSTVGLPGWAYALLGPGMPLYRTLMARRRPAGGDEPAAADESASALAFP